MPGMKSRDNVGTSANRIAVRLRAKGCQAGAPVAVGAPVRAKLVTPETLPEFRWSSLPMFMGKNRPTWLESATVLAESGGLPDTRAGWRRYVGYLGVLAEEEATLRQARYGRLSRGWAIGSAEFRAGLKKELVAAGGVAANVAIRNALQEIAANDQITMIVPPPQLCTDNGAMIAWAGAERLALGLTDAMAAPQRARWKLDEAAETPTKFINTRARH